MKFQYISYSMLKMYKDCPLKFKFRYIDNLRVYEQDRPYLSLGNCIHNVLRDFFKIRDVSQRTLSKIQELLNKYWTPKEFSSKEEELEYRAQAEDILTRFYNSADVKIQPSYIEQRFEIPILKGTYLVGKIDRIDKYDDGVEVLDYKTGRYVPSEEEVKNDLQLLIYAIAVWEILRLPIKMLSLYFLPQNMKISVSKTPQEIYEGKEYIIKSINELFADTEFLPRASGLCKFCDFLVICPLSGFGLKPLETKDMVEGYKNMIKYLESVREGLYNLYTSLLEMVGIFDTTKLLDEAGKKLMDLAKVEKTCVLNYTVDGYEVVFNKGYMINPEKLSNVFECTTPLIERQTDIKGYPRLIKNIKDDEIFYEFFSRDETISDLCIFPLHAKNKFLGLVFVSNKKDKTTFTDFDIKYIQNIITQTSILLYNTYLYEESITDSLTRLYTKAHILTKLKEEFERSKRYNLELCLMMLDIDHFKPINDTYGHIAGDRVLKQLSNILKSSFRSTDMIGRYGGEEFIVILPHTNLDDATKVAERLRAKVESTQFPIPCQVTISIGIARWNRESSVEELIELSDKALYQAKNSGRNKVCIA